MPSVLGELPDVATFSEDTITWLSKRSARCHIGEFCSVMPLTVTLLHW